MDETYLTVREVAERLRVTRQAVYNWITEGRLKAVRAGKTLRIPASALAAFLEPFVPGDRIEDEDGAPGQPAARLKAA